MDVVRKELGYQTVQVFHSPKSFSSFLKFDCIMRADLVSDWKDAVRMSAGLLVKRGFVEESYVDVYKRQLYAC